MSAREAARILDVKRATLYAYVSRGMVRSVAGPQGRPKLYLRADIERLAARRDARRGHGAVAAGALRWGEPVLDSAITEITTAGPRYRGHLATDLAGRASFERVAELLWAGSLDEDAPACWPEAADMDSVRALHELLPADTPPLARLAALVPLVAARDPHRLLAPEPAGPAEMSRARALIATMAASLAPPGQVRATPSPSGPSVPGVAERLLWATTVRPSALRSRRAVAVQCAVIDQALVLMADHELNASAFAARVAASAGADLYACVSAGLAALSGPHHGGACDRVQALVRECGRPARARHLIRQRSRRGEPIPGFGHPLYPDGDPRAQRLMKLAPALARQRPSRDLAVLLALARAMERAGQQPPAVDFALVTLCAALRLSPGAATALFAVGRTAGFIAHALEQRAAGFLLRPRARYVDAALTS